MIDFRSDTVTRPTLDMRRAMFEAEVGDDVFGEDPTVVRLQERVAELLGKEAALFVPSGVMSNQLALMVHTRPGDEVIIERNGHVFNYESGAPAVLSGVQLHVVDGARGVMTAEQVEAAVRPGYYWEAPTRLVCLENTVNKAGGVIYPQDEVERIGEVARAHGLAYHLDGARLWNAAVAAGTPEHVLAAPFDTVSVCLSKGLGAPVGSVLAGSADHVRRAHRFRKMLGGGMRQVGILAAAGLHALEHHRAGLADDHAKARRLAEGLAALDAFDVDARRVDTNIVLFDVADGPAAPVLERFADQGVLMVPFGPRTIRATLHRDVSMEDVEAAVSAARSLFGRG